MYKFNAQNELISNWMPATGLKIVRMGACLPWCSISSSFQNSLKTSGHRGFEFLLFWCRNLIPFLLLKSLWSSLTFLFNEVSNVLYMWKIWNAGRSIQHPDSSTTKRLHGVRDFQQDCQIWTRLTIEPFSTSKHSILNEPWPTGHDDASGPCSHMASFLHDIALVGICR